METAIKLLMRDGAVSVALHPRLTVDQYAELLACVNRAATKDELRRELEQASQRWKCDFEFDKAG